MIKLKNLLLESTIDEKIKHLTALLDANQKFNETLDEDGHGRVRRAINFQKKWGRHPLKLKEVASIKSEIVKLKRAKFRVLKQSK
jgi:hypothetical protein